MQLASLNLNLVADNTPVIIESAPVDDLPTKVLSQTATPESVANINISSQEWSLPKEVPAPDELFHSKPMFPPSFHTPPPTSSEHNYFTNFVSSIINNQYQLIYQLVRKQSEHRNSNHLLQLQKHLEMQEKQQQIFQNKLIEQQNLLNEQLDQQMQHIKMC